MSTGRRTRRVSVTLKASNKTERWRVWLVTDRVGTAATRGTDVMRCRVGDIVGLGQVKVGFTPRRTLLQDGFEAYVALVNDYKGNGGPQSFVAGRCDPFALATGDSGDGQCTFHTHLHAVISLHIEDRFSWTAVNTFN
ncbi:hypothetical protein ON010_g12844 [Phytophthora cinnamomi]|nr:hypothetical protein ON010_g12844 [Phytophthora cinnamomi]